MTFHFTFFPSAMSKAFGQAYSTQRKVAEDGEINEETLLQESATKEAYYMGRLLELQSALKYSRTTVSNTQADSEHMSILLQELREVQYSASYLSIGRWLIRSCGLVDRASRPTITVLPPPVCMFPWERY